MSTAKKLVTVVIPCYNEGASIANVIHGFKCTSIADDYFNFDILVIDNNSKDNTSEEAKNAGARVITETKQGKGHAIRTGFNNIHPSAEYVVMLDGDDTYRPEEVLRMLEPLHHNFCDVVVGSRLGGKIRGDAMHSVNRAGNWLYTHLVRLVYSVNITDVLSGYFAWKRPVVENLAPNLVSSGFAIEMEMITKMSKMGYEIYSVPISYNLRAGESHLRPFHDGALILQMLGRNIIWKHQQSKIIENLELKENT